MPTTALRRAFTLVELTISLVILSAVTILTIESLVSARQLQGLASAEDEVNREAARIIEAMSVDIAESGWWFPDENLLPVGLTADRAAAYFPYVHQQALGAATEGLHTVFTYHARPESAVRILPGRFVGRANLLGHLRGGPADGETKFGADRTGYLTSHYARSQELIFVRQATMGWTADPSARSLPTLRFPEYAPDGTTLIDWSNDAGADYSNPGNANRIAAGVLMPSAWERNPLGPTPFQRRAYDADGDGAVAVDEGVAIVAGSRVHPTPYGLALPSAKLTSATQLTLENQWETIDQPNYDPNTLAQPLREYTYCVVPSPIGMGRLVRAYTTRNDAANAARPVGVDVGQRLPQSDAAPTRFLVVDQVLSDEVVRVVFDTFRTDPDLLINEVRVRLYLARVSAFSGHDQVVTRTAEAILLMRARSTAAADAADATQAVQAVVLDN